MAARCVVIATHEHLMRKAAAVCGRHGLPCEVVFSKSNAIAIELAKKYCADGSKAIVSRGGTAKAIAEHVNRPVIPIEISLPDLVDSILRVRHLGKKIGLIIDTELFYDLRRIRELSGVEVVKIEIPPGGNLIDTIDLAAGQGVGAIVGGVAPVHFATAAGMPALLVESSEESIHAALVKAEEWLRIEERLLLRDETLKEILDHVPEGVLVANAEGQVVLLNRSAEKLLNVNRSNVLGRRCRDALPFLPGMDGREGSPDENGEWCKVNGSPLLRISVPVALESGGSAAISTFYGARLLERLRAREQEELHLKGHVAQYTFDHIITDNPAMRRVIECARSFSQVESTILITGETGTGKEMLAQSIHNAGERRNRPFVAINCASIPDSILESELFGYEAGAFTGAAKGGKKGYFEMAEGGTLFLDEIGEIAPNLQSKLLRVLQQREIVRVGGDRVVPVDIRIIVATLVDMDGEVSAGRFRRDLYYRLNVLRLSIPPLRNRLEDLPLLIRELAGKIAERLKLPPVTIKESLLQRFADYPWMGNVRELENALERLTIIQKEKIVAEEEVEAVLKDMRLPECFADDAGGSMADIEKKAILDALRRSGGDKMKASKMLGISHVTLWRRLKEWGVTN